MAKETQTKNVRVKKFIPSPSSSRAVKNEADNYFILMDFPILKSFIQNVSICTECMSSNVTLSNNAIYEWDSVATWSLSAMIFYIKLVFTPEKNVQGLSRSLGEIPMKFI